MIRECVTQISYRHPSAVIPSVSEGSGWGAPQLPRARWFTRATAQIPRYARDDPADLRLAALQPPKRRLNGDERRHSADHHGQTKDKNHLHGLTGLAKRLGAGIRIHRTSLEHDDEPD